MKKINLKLYITFILIYVLVAWYSGINKEWSSTCDNKKYLTSEQIKSSIQNPNWSKSYYSVQPSTTFYKRGLIPFTYKKTVEQEKEVKYFSEQR